MADGTVVSMRGIVKRFTGVIANDHISIDVTEGEAHCLLGENGAGKTTLMNVLYGLYKRDEGQIYIRGQEANIAAPVDAIRCGIGMVHQHFMLIPVFSVLENVILGTESTMGGLLEVEQSKRRLMQLAEKFNLPIDPSAKVQDISVAMQQRVEILRLLYRGARIMIMDEPTAVLTPQEVDDLFQILTLLKKTGRTIIFITHKLREVMEFSDRVSVLRSGRLVGTMQTQSTNADALTRMMVGKDVVFQAHKTARASPACALKVVDIRAKNRRNLPALRGLSFHISEGEIVGLAGVDGNGQTELAEVLTGHRRTESGRISLYGRNLTNLTARNFLAAGVSYVPADRVKEGLILEFALYENILLGYQDRKPFARGIILDHKKARAFCKEIIQQFDIRAASTSTLTRFLSGGNQQKAVIGRELRRNPRLLIAVQPTRGLDVGATEYVHHQILQAREEGKAILLISLELNEVLLLSDRILVICDGGITGEFTSGEATREKIGLCMAGVSAEP